MSRRNNKQLMTPTRVRRLGSKLHRMAYELEHDAHRMLIDGDATTLSFGQSIRALSSTLGQLARRMESGE